MKKALLALICIATMLAAVSSLKAQEITITLNPEWNWISYPRADILDFTEAMGSFVPMEGDVIATQDDYAEYSDGEWYGTIEQFFPGWGYMYYSNRTESVTFSFQLQPVSPVTITTLEPTDVTATSAMVASEVTIPEGCHVFLRGLCWGTEPNPDIDGDHIAGDAVAGDQSYTLVGLNSGIIYYVRAYVVTDYGLVYGEEQNFTTLDNSNNVPEGALNGLFTINANGDQVYFSQGNLQYQASTNTWRFAENQWDYVGDGNTNISPTYDGWIDLFGWGTSGYHDSSDPNNVNYQPWSTSMSQVNSSYNYYGYGPSTNMTAPNLTGTSANYDWGVYNSISNGGNSANQWHTLNRDEWYYLLNTRNTTSGIRYVYATVNNVNGAILLPDDWSTNTFSLNSDPSYSSNTISELQWMILESAGAVFLPAAGGRNGTLIDNAGLEGTYWSATYFSNSSSGKSACGVHFFNYGDFYTVVPNRFRGNSVRLVQDYNP